MTTTTMTMTIRNISHLILAIIPMAAEGLSHLTSRHQRQRAPPRNYQISEEILQGLREQSSSSSRNGALLDIERDFYDASTGLHSEGVWHNCMGGMAALQLRRNLLVRGSKSPSSSSSRSHHYRDDAHRIAESLFEHSWDGTSFRRRSWSGNWDHSKLLASPFATTGDATDVVQPNYYMESSEHRCIQHAIALAFWSMLAREHRGSGSAILSQQALILDRFVDQFWNGKRWTTVSRTQGSGTTLRLSASSGTAKTSSSLNGTYFRAVDQAIAVLALSEHIKLLDSSKDIISHKDERDRMVRLVEATCEDLLDNVDGFGYCNLSNARTYLGIDRNRNFWHEGWVMLALASATQNIWPMDARGGRLEMLWNGLKERYTAGDTADATSTAGETFWHWPLSQKDAKSNVQYCGDNVLAYAVRRNLRCNNNLSTEENKDDDDDDVAFWNFVETLRSGNDHRLASVADVYTQVRLHPNMELAALLVWPPSSSAKTQPIDMYN
uniref:Uncharacterized protein n=1 Tax=Corethron hystrix TaxID=216773 RepID=A0A7S1BY36_9STRA|mmetsp:Transcript_4311/g.8379  ORF Transcript_4311/g.8379 Transcript_4311/m.8379 type:complete len:496 (+) Transcript_4311:114-1601(+)